uniref:DUF4408 domain-containing protein n=1 Tax=Kalanchoe fedtschenkoi TaxID=63787 RepID=A0A7N0V670_KALFE
MASSHITSFKVVLMSTGLLSLTMALKVSVPVIGDFILYEAPMLWNYLVSCFRPPYLYLLINSIIITIAASSKLQSSSSESDSTSTDLASPQPVERSLISEKDFADAGPEFDFVHPMANVVVDDDDDETGRGDAEARVSDAVADDGDPEDEFEISRGSWMPLMKGTLYETESAFFDKPSASARFSSRRSPRSSPEVGRVLGVSKRKASETLENTWRTITDGRPMPLARHLRKSDTFNNPTMQQQAVESPPHRMMQKSETFGGSNLNTTPSPGSGRLRRESSLSQDELNRRVEAFINKFNEEMRLQRHESLYHYKQMVWR